MKKILIIFIILIIILILTLFSIIKFHVYNPFSAFTGMIQILFTDTEYTVVQNIPNKVIFAQPNRKLLDDYMKERGFKHSEEEQLGSVLVYRKKDQKEIIHFSINKYYSKWIWD